MHCPATIYLTYGTARPDAEGTELPNDKCAWQEAARAFPEMVSEQVPKLGRTYGMSVCRDDRAQVYELRYTSSGFEGI